MSAARRHLERALELDPEIAELYPWLCFLFMRQNEIERALRAGQRAVELQPDLVHEHYFLGLAHFAAAEFEAGRMQPAVRHLLDASRVGAHWQASSFVLSSAAAAFVLGDVELRHGQAANALVAFRRAWHMVQEHPRIMAYLRTATRAQSGLAAA